MSKNLQYAIGVRLKYRMQRQNPRIFDSPRFKQILSAFLTTYFRNWQEPQFILPPLKPEDHNAPLARCHELLTELANKFPLYIGRHADDLETQRHYWWNITLAPIIRSLHQEAHATNQSPLSLAETIGLRPPTRTEIKTMLSHHTSILSL